MQYILSMAAWSNWRRRRPFKAEIGSSNLPAATMENLVEWYTRRIVAPVRESACEFESRGSPQIWLHRLMARTLRSQRRNLGSNPSGATKNTKRLYIIRKVGRAVDCTGPENRSTETYRGSESPTFLHASLAQ